MKGNDRLEMISTLRDTGNFQVFNGILFVKTTKYGWIPADGRREFHLYRDILSKINKDMEATDIRAVVQSLQATVEEKHLTDKTTIHTPTQSINVLTGIVSPKTDNGVQLGIKYNYNPTPTPVAWWDEALKRAIPDQDARLAYYEMVGLTMIADKRHEVSYWFTGPAGTGKSTIVNSVVQGIHFDYNTSNLEPSEWKTDGQSFYTMANKLVNISSDSSNNKKLETGVFKKLASGEYVTANIKYYAPVSFENTALLVSVGNEMPVITEKTNGPFRRMIPIPMNVKVDKATKHTSIKQEIAENKDGVLEYIVSKAINSVISLYERDAPIMPKVSEEAIEELKDDNSSVRQWLKEEYTHTQISTYMTGTEGHGMRFADLGTKYNEWARANGYGSTNAKNIKAQVKEIIDEGLVPEIEVYKRHNALYLRLTEKAEV